MSELEFFLLIGFLIENSNTMDLIKFLEKKKKFHIQIVAVTLKMTSCRTMRIFLKESENPRLYEQKKFLF
jgi:hypothetical protein